MKVILKEHVDHLGERGQIVSVAAGYARNFLLPKGLAVEATPGNLKQVEQQRKVWAAKEVKEIEEAQAFARALEAAEITIFRKAGENETLYGSVTRSDIAEALAQQGIEVDRRKLQLNEPLKQLGEFEVPIRLHPKVMGKVRVRVAAEPGTEKAGHAPQD